MNSQEERRLPAGLLPLTLASDATPDETIGMGPPTRALPFQEGPEHGILLAVLNTKLRSPVVNANPEGFLPFLSLVPGVNQSQFVDAYD